MSDDIRDGAIEILRCAFDISGGVYEVAQYLDYATWDDPMCRDATPWRLAREARMRLRNSSVPHMSYEDECLEAAQLLEEGWDLTVDYLEFAK